MRGLITITLLLIVSQANAGERVVSVQHDSVRGVTCWILNNSGISCLPDISLSQTPTGTTTEESQAPRASLVNNKGENGQFPTTPRPAQNGFQL